MSSKPKQEELKSPSTKDKAHSVVSSIMTELRDDIANHINGNRSRDSYITHARGVEGVMNLINSEVTSVLDELESKWGETVDHTLGKPIKIKFVSLEAIQLIRSRYE